MLTFVFWCVVLWFSLFCPSIRLWSSFFAVFSVSFWVVVESSWYSSLFTCWYISSISRPGKPIFVNYYSDLVWKSLTCCIKSIGFCSNFCHSFSLLSLCRIALTITVKYFFVVFLIPFILLVVMCVPENRTANIRRMPVRPPCWLSREQMPIMAPRLVFWVPRSHFFGYYIVAIADLGVVYYLRSYRKCDQVLLKVRRRLSGSQNKYAGKRKIKITIEGFFPLFQVTWQELFWQKYHKNSFPQRARKAANMERKKKTEAVFILYLWFRLKFLAVLLK